MLGLTGALAVLSLVLLAFLGAPFLYAATLGGGGGATGDLLGTSQLLHSVGFGVLARALWSGVTIGPFTYTTSAQQSRTPALAAAAASLLSFICGVAVLSAANAGPADGAEEVVVADDGSGGWYLEDHRVLGLWLGIAGLWDSAIRLAAAFVAAADRALGYLRPPEGPHEVGRARQAGGLGEAAHGEHNHGRTTNAHAGHRGADDVNIGASPAAGAQLLSFTLMLNAVLHFLGSIACALDEPVGMLQPWNFEERAPRRCLQCQKTK
jgi:hypothetical protein